MNDFYRKALKKAGKLTSEQYHELLVSAADGIARFETVLDSLPDGILVCDEKHCLVMANKYAQRLFPLEYSEAKNIPIWMIVRDDRLMAFFEEALLNGEKVQDWEIDVDVNGRNRLLSISMMPLVYNHRITGSLIYIEDITERRNRESRLRQAENLASLTTLAAGVAHEIKNPLGSISIHLQLMQKALAKNKDSSMNKYLDVLNEEVERLNRTVVDFLFAVRPISLELREGNINKLVSDLIDFVRPEMEQSKIRCVLNLETELPTIVMDERYMKQVLLNLVKNAQAAMKGGGTLTVATALAENEIKLSVADTGVGISPKNLAKIFDPYFTTKETGTGLGLTLAFKIIREHRGDIAVQSREGHGSCFTITLPVIQKERRLITWNSNKET